ncbi:hypothetical protein C2G38_2206452 [Gigaspora rosea]|uniref:Uncharacterized protein n=1 Tax=Gigaspora rosea TaxID=44941 RepID=A0A397UJL3_9GLOM|nr:hypothetical protein C2G38_2206452 [Gigaspora rosea]
MLVSDKSGSNQEYINQTFALQSGNTDNDDCIKEFQLKATKYEKVIPFDRFSGVRKNNEGFSGICPQRIIQGWTSGNKNIDDCIKQFQFNAIGYDYVIEGFLLIG